MVPGSGPRIDRAKENEKKNEKRLCTGTVILRKNSKRAIARK